MQKCLCGTETRYNEDGKLYCPNGLCKNVFNVDGDSSHLDEMFDWKDKSVPEKKK